jgi:FlaA1/EpsC-like NDP-sugar epimerase
LKPAVLIVGAGGHGRSVLEALRLAGEQAVLGFVDDTAAVGADILGTPVLGATATLGQ